MALNQLNAANSNVLAKYKDTSFHNATCDRQLMGLDQTVDIIMIEYTWIAHS